MSKFEVDESVWDQLQGKVIVLTGGSNGIGAEIVKLLHKSKANVVFGDLDTDAAESLTESLGSPTNVTFVRTDVTSYEDNIALFKTALQKHERIDHAVANAGILEQGKWLDPELTVETVEAAEPPTSVIEVNLKAVAYFTRIAIVYLRHGLKPSENKSITLVSSAAGFRESPGLLVYNSAKHGVMGLMRGARGIIWDRDGIRINNICPGITETAMTTSIVDLFKDSGQAVNTPLQVARYALALQTTKGLNGKAVYVEGGRGWEIEDGLYKTMPQWLGEAPTERLREGLRLVGQGDAWKIK